MCQYLSEVEGVHTRGSPLDLHIFLETPLVGSVAHRLTPRSPGNTETISIKSLGVCESAYGNVSQKGSSYSIRKHLIDRPPSTPEPSHLPVGLSAMLGKFTVHDQWNPKT